MKESNPNLSICFVCDAGMGSSAMGASLLKKMLKKKGLSASVSNASIASIPPSADVLITNQSFYETISRKGLLDKTYFVQNFLSKKEYERIIDMAFFRKKKKDNENAILKKENIRLNQKAANSDEAIVSIGNKLLSAGYISEGYIQGMLNRDHSLTTYIGNDIAIPHGEYEVKDCVKKTGLAVDIYPEGIAWADGNVRIVIGIAATTDEHIIILQNIAEKLGDMDVVEKVVNGDVDYIYNLLTSK